jgi:hypothetical protein
VLPLAQVSIFPGVTSELVIEAIPLVISQPDIKKENMARPVRIQPALQESNKEAMVIAPNMYMGASPLMPDSVKPKIPRKKMRLVRTPAFIKPEIGRMVKDNKIK